MVALHANAHRSMSLATTELNSLAFVANERMLVLSDTSGATLIDPETMGTLGRMDLPLTGPSLSPLHGDDLWLYTKWEGPVQWRMAFEASGKCLELKKDLSFERGSMGLMAITDSSDTIAVSSGDGIIIRSPMDWKSAFAVATPTISQYLSIHPDGAWIAAGSVTDSWMRLWRKNAKAWDLVPQSTEFEQGKPFFSRWMKNEMLLFSRDNLLAYPLNHLAQPKVLLKSLGAVTATAECVHRPYLALAGPGIISIRNIQNQFESLLELPVEMRDGDVIRCVEFDPDGTQLTALVDGGTRDTLHVWSLELLANTLKERSLGFTDWNAINKAPVNVVQCIDLELGVWNRF